MVDDEAGEVVLAELVEVVALRRRGEWPWVGGGDSSARSPSGAAWRTIETESQKRWTNAESEGGAVRFITWGDEMRRDGA